MAVFSFWSCDLNRDLFQNVSLIHCTCAVSDAQFDLNIEAQNWLVSVCDRVVDAAASDGRAMVPAGVGNVSMCMGVTKVAITFLSALSHPRTKSKMHGAGGQTM